MYAITVKQPWAEAIARHGKNVENRTRRPPRQLLGQRIAIHVGQSVIDWQLMRDGIDPYHDHRFDLYLWATHSEGHRSDAVPHAGRIIATARLVGWAENYDGEWHASCMPSMDAAQGSPWFTGPVGWVLADVRPLAVPVGQTQDCSACPNRDGYSPEPRGYCLCSAPIRGNPSTFALSPEVEAAVLRQEHNNA